MSKQKMVTKSMKYRIKYNKVLYNILKDIQYDVWRVKNRSVTQAHDWQQFSFSYKNKVGRYPKDKDLLSKTLVADVYKDLKHIGRNIASSTYGNAVKEAVEKYNNDKASMLKGEISIVNYKRNGSFPIKADQIKHIEKVNNKIFTAKLSLLSKEGVKSIQQEINDGNRDSKYVGVDTESIKTQLPVTLMSGNGATQILERVSNGEYKLRDSRISIDKKNRFYLVIAYQFLKEEKELDGDRVMGVDIGVNIPAVIAISDDDYYYRHVGDGQEILDFQKQMNSRKKRLQRSRKWAGTGSVGHGVKTRIKPLDKLSGKIANFKDTKNHQWSRYIVDEALRNECGVIQMEDLSGISEDSTFLKAWTFYDLQEKIRYKAEEVGVNVNKINPKYTSSMCNKCRFIHTKDNGSKHKDWRPTQDKFVCQYCGHGSKHYVNADINAARNISIKNVGQFIDKQLKFQDGLVNHEIKYNY